MRSALSCTTSASSTRLPADVDREWPAVPAPRTMTGVQCASATIVVENPPPSAGSSVPSAESSVLAGTGTPAESQPDTAQSRDGVNPLPTIGFSFLLVAALATLAYANVKTVRSRN